MFDAAFEEMTANMVAARAAAAQRAREDDAAQRARETHWVDDLGGEYTITETDPDTARYLLAVLWGADYETLRQADTPS